MQIEGTKQTFIMNFSVLDYLKRGKQQHRVHNYYYRDMFFYNQHKYLHTCITEAWRGG